MIFQDQLIALLKNPGEEYGYRMYEVDHTGLLLYSRRCYDNDPIGDPGHECSRDSKRSLDNNNVHGIEPSLNYGFYNFETDNEDIVDIYIDQPKQVVIFIQANKTLNYTKIYVNPFTTNNRRTQFINILPEYLQIGEISGFSAHRTVKVNDTIYMVNESPSHQIKKVDISISWSGGLFLGAYSGNIIQQTIATYPTQILDITYDTLRQSVVCLTPSSIVSYNDSWTESLIPNTTYAKEYKSITHDYVNDLYFIGNMSGVGTQYNFRGPTRSLIDLDNILNEASIFTIFNPLTGTVTDVPYIKLPNQQSYRYPIIVPIDVPANTPILPCKTYCNIGRIRYYNMNGISKIICSDDFVYKVHTQSENTFIYRSILGYSGYTNEQSASSGLIDGILTTLATTDDLNAIEDIESNMAKWISFDYGHLIDEECNKVIVSDVKICHMRTNRCTGSDNYIRNGDFVYGLSDWNDGNGDEFVNPYDSDIYDRDLAHVKMHNVTKIQQFVNLSNRISLQIAMTHSGYTDPLSSVIYKFSEGTGTITYTEEIRLSNIPSPYIYNIDIPIEGDMFSIELNDRAIAENGIINLDYVLICDITDQKVCQPGYELVSYDSFIGNTSWEILTDSANSCDGTFVADQPPQPGLPQPGLPEPTQPTIPEPSIPILSIPKIPTTPLLGAHNFYIIERTVNDNNSQNQANARVNNKIYSIQLSINRPAIVRERQFSAETEWVINNQNNFNQPPNVAIPISGPYEFVYALIDMVDTVDMQIAFMNSSLYRWQNQRPRWLSSYIETPIEIASNALTSVAYGDLSLYVGTMAGEGQLPCPGDYNCNSNLFLSSSWFGQLYKYSYKDELFNTTPIAIKLNTSNTVPVAIKYQDHDGSISIASNIKQTSSEYSQFYKRYSKDGNLQLSIDISGYPTATSIDEINVSQDLYLSIVGTLDGTLLAIMHNTSSITQIEEIKVSTDGIYDAAIIVDNGTIYVVTSTKSSPIRYKFGLDRANLLRVSDEDRGPQDFNCIYKNGKCIPTDYSKALQRLNHGYGNVYLTNLSTKSSVLVYSSKGTIVKLKKDIYSKFV